MSTVAFSVRTVHPHAAPFYNLFPQEPIPGGPNAFVTITKVVELPDNRVLTLLAAIRQHVTEKGSSIIVVSHGTEEGISLTLGRERGSGPPLDARRLIHLRANLLGQKDDIETANLMELGTYAAARNPGGVADLVALKEALAPVRALKLARVDLRACVTGRRLNTLKMLQFFFDADLCCAPRDWDTFGPVPFADITTNPASWRKFKEAHPNAMTVGTGAERFALDYKVMADEYKVMLAAIASSQAAIDTWVKNHLPPNNRYKGGSLFYHGLTPDQKTIIFAGEGTYRDHLAAVTDGRDATIRTNEPVSPEGF